MVTNDSCSVPSLSSTPGPWLIPLPKPMVCDEDKQGKAQPTPASPAICSAPLTLAQLGVLTDKSGVSAGLKGELIKSADLASGKLSQEAINLAAIRIKMTNPNEYDAFTKLLAGSGGCVTIPVDQYIQTVNKIAEAGNENALPRFKATIFLSAADRGSQNGEQVKISVKPASVGVTSPGSFWDTYGPTRYYINIEHNGKRLYVTGEGEYDYRFEYWPVFPDKPSDRLNKSAHFDQLEAKEMVGLIDRALSSIETHPELAGLKQNLLKVRDFLNFRVNGQK